MKAGGGRGPLAADAGAGFGWNMAGGVTRAMAGLVINTMLARMLGPEPFGQLAMAAVVVGLGGLVGGGGGGWVGGGGGGGGADPEAGGG